MTALVVVNADDLAVLVRRAVAEALADRDAQAAERRPASSLGRAQEQTAGAVGTKEAARRLGVSPATLATWRCTGAVRVPHGYAGRKVIYCVEDLDRWLSEQTAKAGAATGGSA